MKEAPKWVKGLIGFGIIFMIIAAVFIALNEGSIYNNILQSAIILTVGGSIIILGIFDLKVSNKSGFVKIVLGLICIVLNFLR